MSAAASNLPIRQCLSFMASRERGCYGEYARELGELGGLEAHSKKRNHEPTRGAVHFDARKQRHREEEHACNPQGAGDAFPEREGDVQGRCDATHCQADGEQMADEVRRNEAPHLERSRRAVDHDRAEPGQDCRGGYDGTVERYRNPTGLGFAPSARRLPLAPQPRRRRDAGPGAARARLRDFLGAAAQRFAPSAPSRSTAARNTSPRSA